MTLGYIRELTGKLSIFDQRMTDLRRLNQLRMRKIVELVEYFGEDASTCDTVQIFTVLQKFFESILVSKNAYERKVTQN